VYHSGDMSIPIKKSPNFEFSLLLLDSCKIPDFATLKYYYTSFVNYDFKTNSLPLTIIE
jgi:hypothetical protein